MGNEWEQRSVTADPVMEGSEKTATETHCSPCQTAAIIECS